MSWKYSIERIAHCHYILTAGGGAPAHIFMTPELLQQSEELLWREVVTIKNFPGVVSVAVTPDAHASGNGIPVGVAVETDGSTIIPCAAGYDISCGMAAVKTNLTAKDVADDVLVYKWIDAVTSRMALGAGTHRAPKQRQFSTNDIDEILFHGALALTQDKSILECLERSHLPVDSSTFFVPERAKRGYNQVLSLGGGNHFCTLEVELTDGKIVPHSPVWLLIHTGSRGFGHGTAEHFFNKGAEAMGLPKKDKEEVWFGTDTLLGKQYINQMNAAANFAIANRLAIFGAVQEATEEVLGGESKLFFEISHNLVQSERDGHLIHRKGATRAFPGGHPALKGTRWHTEGHPVLVPGSMGTASAILYAEPDAKKSLYSINHGCGRVMSRRYAKEKLAHRLGLVDTEAEALKATEAAQGLIDEEMASMNILINTQKTPLDECLHAYKDIDDVLAAVEGAGLAKVVHKVFPRAVIKGND